MFEQETQQRRQGQAEVAGRAAAETGTDPFVMAAVASVVLSQYMFFVKGNREMGIFIGLWPPTFLAFGSHFNQIRMKERLDYMTSSRGLMNAIERAVSGSR